ncbi:PAS domain S-box protein [bacterium]|nr:PAS domain S-box protein [bacterium]
MDKVIIKILDIVSRLRNARTFQEKMALIAEGIGVCGWTYVHLYVFDRDKKEIKSAAYWGIDEDGRKHLETHRMKLHEIETILMKQEFEQYKIGRCYYISHSIDDEFINKIRSTGWVPNDEKEKSDAWHPQDMLFIPLYGFGGKVVGLVSVDDPIDSKIPTEESLRSVELFVDYAVAFIEEDEFENYFSKSKAVLAEVFNLSPVAIVVSDENDKIININPAAENIFSFKIDEVIGKDTSFLFSPSENLENVLQQRQNGIFKGEVLMHQKDGEEFWGYVVNVPIENFAGEIESYLLMALDVTETKNLQYYLIRAEKLAGIGILASGIAHELNNPLYGILGLAETIVEEDDVKIIHEYANDIVEYSREAAEIVKDLAGYSYSSRMETASTVNPNITIQNALKMIRRLGKLNNIDIEEDYGELTEINASASELQQVFVNLITNAADSILDKGKLTITTLQVRDFVEIRVSDTGSGIPEKYRAHIFEPFFTTKPVGEGTGLGLYISYRIINKYNGTIDFKSSKNNGTIFTVKFPTKQD